MCVRVCDSEREREREEREERGGRGLEEGVFWRTCGNEWEGRQLD